MKKKILRQFISDTASNYLVIFMRMASAVVLVRLYYQTLSANHYGIWIWMWTVLGYTIFFDFGLGVALQKKASECDGAYVKAMGSKKRQDVLYAKKLVASFKQVLGGVVGFYLGVGLIIALIVEALIFSSGGQLVETLFASSNVGEDNQKLTQMLFLIFALFNIVLLPSAVFAEVLKGLGRISVRNFVLGTQIILQFLATLFVLSPETLGAGGQNQFLSWQNQFLSWQNQFLSWQNGFLSWQNAFLSSQNQFLTLQNTFLGELNAFLLLVLGEPLLTLAILHLGIMAGSQLVMGVLCWRRFHQLKVQAGLRELLMQESPSRASNKTLPTFSGKGATFFSKSGLRFFPHPSFSLPISPLSPLPISPLPISLKSIGKIFGKIWRKGRELLQFSTSAYSVMFANIIIFRVDALLVSSMISLSALSLYQVASRPAFIFDKLVGQFQEGIAPLSAKLSAGKEEQKLAKLFIIGNKIAAFIALPAYTYLLLFGQALLAVWIGVEEPIANAIHMVLLSAFFTLIIFRSVSSKMLLMSGQHKFLGYAALAEAFCNLALSVALAKFMGVLGVALGTLLPAIFFSVFIIFPRATKEFATKEFATKKFAAKKFSQSKTQVIVATLRTPFLACLPLAGIFSYWAREGWFSPHTWSGLLVAFVGFSAGYLALYFCFMPSNERRGIKKGLAALLKKI